MTSCQKALTGSLVGILYSGVFLSEKPVLMYWNGYAFNFTSELINYSHLWRFD